MESLSLATDLEVIVENGGITLQGELHRDNALTFLKWLETQGKMTFLDLGELDIADGIAATHAVNAIRYILEGQERLCLRGAPQVLAHNLYRSRLLENGRISLTGMREDEAYG